jgi:hypothetical protein
MIQLYQIVNFGSSKAGLSTVSYSLFDIRSSLISGPISVGIQDLGDGSYGAVVDYPSGPPFQGRITWSTGEILPVYASDDINLSVSITTFAIQR